MEKKTCWNCLHEYHCDWSPAGEHDYCKEWVKEYKGEDGTAQCQNRQK